MTADVLLAGQDVFGPPDERKGEVVDVELHRKAQVLEVLVGQRGQRQRATGNADAFPLPEEAAAHH